MEDKSQTRVDQRRILLFLGLAFGIAWLSGLAIYLTGGLVNSPQIMPGLSLALVLVAIPYMWAPAISNLLTRLLTGEGWSDVGLRLHFRKGWPFWVIGWVVPGLMTIGGAAVFFLVFRRYFDPGLELVQQNMLNSPLFSHFSPWEVVAFEAVLAILISPVANSLATFGEEFGWRAYLLPKLLPLGWRKATLFLGVIWGVWHWPVIFMGYEYGFTYPGHPWLGLAALAILVVTGAPNPLLGPLPIGIIASVGFAAVALCLFFWPGQKVSLLVIQNNGIGTNKIVNEGKGK
ncbi:MAG: CPBP family glutamic-type intramembrane protease [Anaerolineales bacterium]